MIKEYNIPYYICTQPNIISNQDSHACFHTIVMKLEFCKQHWNFSKIGRHITSALQTQFSDT